MERILYFFLFTSMIANAGFYATVGGTRLNEDMLLGQYCLTKRQS